MHKQALQGLTQGQNMSQPQIMEPAQINSSVLHTVLLDPDPMQISVDHFASTHASWSLDMDLT